MKQLLPDFAPLTFSWGFLEVPLDVAANFFAEWQRSVSRGAELIATPGTLEELLRGLEPLTLPPTKDLLVETRSTWTAFFDNSAKGADAASPMSYAARELQCRGLAVTCVPDTFRVGNPGKGIYGAVQFELFAATLTEFLNYERTVAATNDGGKWVFVASGPVQPFEETEQYKKRNVADRFTTEMLERYVRAVGIELFEPSFYGPAAHVVRRVVAKPALTLSLEEARLNFRT